MNNIFKLLFNAPLKRCYVTKSFYPLTLMIRLFKVKNFQNEDVYIPDCMYSRVNILLIKV